MVIHNVKVIPSSNLRPRWLTMEVGGIPQNESEAVEYLQKICFFAVSDVSFLQLSKTVTEYEFITKYSTKLIMNETKLPRVRSASYQRSKNWPSPWGSTLYHIIINYGHVMSAIWSFMDLRQQKMKPRSILLLKIHKTHIARYHRSIFALLYVKCL